MTFPFKTWQEQRDELVASIDDHKKRAAMTKAAHRASMRWVKSREALNTMQFLSWHFQKPQP